MKSLQGIVVLGFLLLAAQSAWAKTGAFEQIGIKPAQVTDPYPLTTRTFSGEICFHRVPTAAVPVACGTLSEITPTHKFRFFYPNLETEVTSNVTLQDATVGQTYSYQGTISTGTTPPTFFVVSELLAEDLIDNVRLEKSLEAQIAAITGPVPSTLTQQLNAVRASLKENYPAAVYEQVHPIKGAINPPTKFTTHNRNYRVEARIDRGDIFQNELSLAKFKLKSLRAGGQPQDIYYIGLDGTERYSTNVKNNYTEVGAGIPASGTIGVRRIDFRVSVAGRTFHYSTIPVQLFIPNLEDTTIPEVTGGVTLRGFRANDPLTVDIEDAKGRMTSADGYFGKYNGNGQIVETFTATKTPIAGKMTTTVNGFNGAQKYRFSMPGAGLTEGTYSFFITASDPSGNYLSEEVPLAVDASGPMVQFALDDNFLTNESEISLPISLFDAVGTTLSVWQNGVEIFFGEGGSFDVPLTLVEGLNLFTVIGTDSLGQQTTVQWSGILDTTPPSIQEIIPANNQEIATQNFVARGKANEAISAAFINGVAAVVQNGNEFSGNVTAYTEGEQQLQIRLVDLMGNEESYTTTYIIAKPLLHISLVSLAPGENDKIIVTGAPGAVRENVSIELSGGFFNSLDVTPNADGSFTGELDFATEIEITASDDNFDFEENYTLNYNVDTTLSGIVRDPSDQPLPGVKVTIVSSGQEATTNASGVFAIANPALGDQALRIDGGTIPVEVTEGLKEYSAVSLNVSVGNRQQNVIERPIYISPKILDGTETIIGADEAEVVSSHAPGVILNVEPGAAIFPGGSSEGSINMMEIPAEKTSVELPEGVQPGTVYALEPSGLKFNSPQNLTLPNSDEFPDGMELVILSKNSETGLWEIDGSAIVDGAEIRTKPGQGITHFSEVFAAPFGMELAEYGDSDKPGFDNQVGIQSTSVDLPSYQRLGSTITPRLVFKSQWANPNVIVNNVFNLPRKYYEYGQVLSSSSVQEFRTWITPDSIETRMAVGDVTSDLVTLRAIEAPDKAIVSYGVDLSELDSGVYPSVAEYEIKYRTLTLRTTKKAKKSGYFSSVKIKKTTSKTQDLLESIFPPDLRSFVYHQNKIESEVGRGWKLATHQKIANPSSDRIMIENEDGSVGSYALNNSVETVVHDPDGLNSVTYKDGLLHFADEKGNIYNLADGQTTPTLAKMTANYQGTIGINSIKITSQTTYCCDSGPFGCEDRCPRYRNRCEKSIYQVNISKKINSLVPTSGGDYAFIDQHGAIFNLTNSEELVAGDIEGLTRIDITSTNSTVNFQPQCQSRIQADCVQENRTFYQEGGIFSTDDNRAPLSACGTKVESSGNFPTIGFTTGVLPETKFNKPLSMIPGTQPNTLIVADTGNNIVRRVDIASNSSQIIAGNQQTMDNGNGGPATSASLYHPRAVALDSLGNLFISTENGYIRKVNPSGVISTLAGKPLAQGGQYVEFGPMATFNLKNPSEMVLDEDEGYLYVADTGNHRIVQIDLQEETARVVAGNGTCDMGAVIEGRPALETSMCSPTSIALDGDKNLYYVDKNNQRLRKIILQADNTGIQRFASTQKDNTSLVRLANGNFERTYRDGTIAYFDPTGLHIATEDLTGRTTEYTYDSEGNLLTIRDPSGSQAQLSYSGGKLATFTDPAGRTTQFNHNGDMLETIDFPDGTSRAFAYDENNQMAEEIDQRGNPTTYAYNALNRLETITKDGVAVGLIDATSANYYNSQDGDEIVIGNNLGPNNNSDTIVNGNGSSTVFVKDINGYVTTIVDAQSQETLIERDAEGRPTKITRPDGQYTEMTYDQATSDLLTRYESATDSTETFTYNLRGQLVQHIDPTGKISTRVYDQNTGLLLSETDPRGVTTTRTYGSLGLVASITNSLNHSQSYVYGSSGNLVRTTTPAGEHTDFGRDPAGNVLTKTDAKNQVTQYSFDLFNRLASVRTPNNLLTSYQYLPTGELSLITAPTSEQTIFEYDALGRMTRKTSPRGQITQLAYDGNGNVVQEIDPKGQVKTFTYDGSDRLLTKVLPDNSYSFTYLDSGELLTVADSDSAFSMSYQEIHGKKYVSAISQSVLNIPNHSINYTYSASGNRLGMSSNYGSTTHNYNNSDLISNVTNHKGEVFGFAYDFANRLTSMSRPNSLGTQNVYDSNSFLTSIQHRRSGTTLASFAYDRDQVNNRTDLTTLSGSHSYQYDQEGQLISASHPEADTLHALETFAYDSVGNRTADNQGSYSYDNKKYRLEEDWKYIYAFDLNGNVITKQEKNFGKTWSFSYSSENQLTGIDITEGAQVTNIDFTYDALGRRTSKTVLQNGVTTIRKYVYDNQEIIAELDGNNQTLVRYTQSGIRTDDTLAMDVTSAGVAAGLAPSAGTYYFLKDGLGSIIDIANSTGTVVQHYVYSSFGKLLKIENGSTDNTENPNIKTPYSYTNREYDQESGLYYYRARYYDAHSGRFLQEDQHPGVQTRPGTIVNTYRYAGSNPIMNTDPGGKFFIPLLIAAAVSGAISAGLTAATSDGNFLTNLFSAQSAQAFVLSFGATVITGGVGYFAGYGAAALGASASSSQLIGALLGGLTGGGIGSLFAPNGREGLGFLLGFATGSISGFMSAGAGFNAFKNSSLVPQTSVPVGNPSNLPIPKNSRSECLAQAAARGVKILDIESYLTEACY